MPTAYEQRFGNQLRKISFMNTTGQQIPPFSCIVVQNGWTLPDYSDDINVTQSPNLNGAQMQDWTVAPYDYYITGTAPTFAGQPGICFRSWSEPLLVSVSGSVAIGSIVGPTPNSFQVQVGAPGFRVVSGANGGKAPVLPSFGPYAGQLPQDTSSTFPQVQVSMMNGGQAAGIQIPIANPFANIDTTVQGAVTRCTFDWVSGTNQWELIAAVPTCPNASSGQ